MAVKDATPPVPPTTGHAAPGGDAMISAFVVGWRLAELYDRDALPPPKAPAAGGTPPQHLPGASEMGDHDHAVVLLEQASTSLAALGSALAGVVLPSLEPVRGMLERPNHDRDDVRREIEAVFLDIRRLLMGTSSKAATGCDLGRLLADTTWLPRSGTPEIWLERFDTYRLANAYRWLDDLSNVFPPRSVAAVGASLRAWERWLNGLRKEDGTVDPGRFDEHALRTLRLQGELWQRLLSGEKDPIQLLGPDDYVNAAEELIRRGRQISGRWLRRLWPVVAVFVGVVGAVLWAILTYAPAGTERLTAALFTAAGALGVSWKGVGATLGNAVTQAQAALWASEVDVAVGRAASLKPDVASRKAGTE